MEVLLSTGPLVFVMDFLLSSQKEILQKRPLYSNRYHSQYCNISFESFPTYFYHWHFSSLLSKLDLLKKGLIIFLFLFWNPPKNLKFFQTRLSSILILSALGPPLKIFLKQQNSFYSICFSTVSPIKNNKNTLDSNILKFIIYKRIYI